MKLRIYEIHIFELRSEEINVKKILAVINATYAVAKRKPEKIRLAGTRTLTSAIPVQFKLHSAVQIYEFHIFLISSSSFPGILRTNLMTSSQLACKLNWLERCTGRYRRGQGSNPGKPDFFRLSFRNCISCVNNCEDVLYIYFFIPQFKYMNFIYS